MKICIISDTHSYHRKVIIPDCDLLIHAGDISFRGEPHIMMDFGDWLKELPIKHKVVIFGNHEVGMQVGHKRKDAIDIIDKAGAHYLEDSHVTLDGIKIYGSPWQPEFYNWEFNLPRGKALAMKWANIPDDVDVLVTHGPPDLILDEAPRGIASYQHVGCHDLMDRIGDLKQLKLHCFGHIHDAYGHKQIGPCHFVNASICTEAYQPTNKPIVVEI